MKDVIRNEAAYAAHFLLPLNIMIQIQVPFLYSEYLNIISDACLLYGILLQYPHTLCNPEVFL